MHDAFIVGIKIKEDIKFIITDIYIYIYIMFQAANVFSIDSIICFETLLFIQLYHIIIFLNGLKI
jgi:hypothetical protein